MFKYLFFKLVTFIKSKTNFCDIFITLVIYGYSY